MPAASRAWHGKGKSKWDRPQGSSELRSALGVVEGTGALWLGRSLWLQSERWLVVVVRGDGAKVLPKTGTQEGLEAKRSRGQC